MRYVLHTVMFFALLGLTLSVIGCAGGDDDSDDDGAGNNDDDAADDDAADDDAADDDAADDDAGDDDTSLFQKRINDSFGRPWDMAYSLGDGVLLTSYDGFFSTYLKVDDNAEIVWVRRFDQSASVAFNNSIVIPDEGVTLGHLSADASKIYLWQTQDFVFDWGKSYDYDADLFVPADSFLSFGARLAGGNVAIVGGTEITTGGGYGLDCAAMVTVTDDSGDIVWSKQYYIEGWYFAPAFLLDNGTNYVLVGAASTIGILTSTAKVGVVVVDKAAGEPVGDAQIYSVDGDLVANGRSSNGAYLAGYAFLPFAGQTLGFVMKLAESGAPVVEWSKAMTSDDFPFRAIDCIEQVGEDLLLGGTAMTENGMGGSNPGQFFAAKTDAELTAFAWSTIYSDTAQSGELLDVGEAFMCKITPDNRALFWGNFTQVNGIGYAIKANLDSGQSACLNEPMDTSIQALDVQYETHPITTSSDVLSNPQSHTIDPDNSDDGLLDGIMTICQGGAD
jgi:hypothetical protein